MSLADREHLPKVVTDVNGIRDILLALDPEIVLLREDISQLIKELYVSTTEKYIDRWEQDFSLPYDGSLTLEQRRQRIKNKLARKKVLNWQNLRLLIKNNVVKPRFYIVNEAENYHFKIFLEQQPQRQEFDLSKFTVVGSPTIVDGVASGFSKEQNYITIPFAYNNFTIKMPILWNGTLPVSSDYYYRIENSTRTEQIVLYQASNGGIEILTTVNGTTFYDFGRMYILANIPAFVTIEKHTGKIYVKVEQENKITFEKTVTINIPTFDNNSVCHIGKVWNTETFCSIDLKQFSITVDGKEVFSGVKNIDYITNELRTSLKQAKPAYLTFDLIVTEFFTRYCGTFSSGTEPL